jgi:enediyne biosynthesis protein E4
MTVSRSHAARASSCVLVFTLGVASTGAAGSAGCTDGAASDAPPSQCKSATAAAALPAGKWFTDVTAEAGIFSGDGGIVGIRVAAADLDGDGWVDLVIHGALATRDTPPTAYVKRVLMNDHGRFIDKTAESGLLDSRDGPGTGRLSNLIVFGDVDNDGDLDAFSGTYQGGTTKPPASADRSEILLNDGKGHFTFAPPGPVSSKALPTSGATFIDYDRDGILDLFVGNFYDASGIEGAGNRLYQGIGDGTLSDVSAASKVLRDAAGRDQAKLAAGDARRAAYGVSSCDIDGDGDVDLITSAYGRGWNELWQNQGDGTFKDIGQGTPFAADDNVDYHDNEFYRCWCAEPANAGKCTPEESQPRLDCSNSAWNPGLDDQPARNGGNTFSTACGDLDNDGDNDILHAEIRHWHIGQSSDPSQILRNDTPPGVTSAAPTFTRLTQEASGLARPHTMTDWNEGDLDVAFFDFDNDGKKDIYLSSTDYPGTYGTLFHQKPDGTFQDVGEGAGVRHYHAHGFVAVDIDNDGDLDLVVSTSTARCGGDASCPATQEVRVYRNDVGAAKNVVQVRLHGAPGKSNAAAIGARVAVTAGGVTQMQEVNGGYGHFGMQHGTVLTFGVGTSCTIDSIEVRWPDSTGTVEKLTNVVPNYLVDVKQGETKPVYTPLPPPASPKR